ncbi:MAG: hypothetical protein ACRERU_12565 [Methylococcales bacterium]
MDFPIEGFIAREVRQGTSIFLTGNAGDGKTHILRKLAPVLRECGAIVVEDATALMRRNDIRPVLDRWREAVAAGVPFCIAINEYPLHLLRPAARATLPKQAYTLDHYCRNRLTYGPDASTDSDGELLVLDLSLRNPLHREFGGRMLAKILNDSDLDAVRPESDQGLALNLIKLRHPQIQDRVLSLFERLCDLGFRASIRELWIMLSRMVLGYRSDMEPPMSSNTGNWYSEVLFMTDERFALIRNLRVTDPASSSHPIWDSIIEDGEKTSADDWAFGIPCPQLAVKLDRGGFKALKRAFYFEHKSGNHCFDLEDCDSREFRRLLHEHRDDDPGVKRQLIEAINRAYCPVSFPGSQNNLYLWNGHRFHEQPSRSFLANRHVSEERLQVLRPQLPKRLREGMPEYKPDHLLLCLKDDRAFEQVCVWFSPFT